ncbi:putative sugar transporter [Trichosporon asahii var. asahii CBS 8904]|uniref:Putative sugar transporter n=1 Tax=Trichosporon asahii var. asahii (strain CBS 8904) TaxID=1220162 RepID=K1WAK7_TRIAC|nr:putative sugar transporter [Trichosporon asahii var. asahii CBS 8904]
MKSDKQEDQYIEQYDDAKADAMAGRRGSHMVGGMIIENPLQVAVMGRKFAATHDLAEKEDLFERAALVARDPDNFQSLTCLSPEEQNQLAFERDHKWRVPKMLVFTMFVCALGAAVQGWDQTGSNGANLSFPVEFGLLPPPATEGAQRRDLLPRAGPAKGAGQSRGDWIVGVINAAPYLAGAIPGVWLSDPLNHWFGRRGEIFITAVILVATPIGSGFSQTWYQLLAIRLVMGIGMGAKAATVAVYSAELAPTRIRGALTMGWQLYVCFGIFLGFAANCVVMNVKDIAWRLQLGSAFIPALPLACFIYLCPESPRWYMKKGKYRKALHSYERIRNGEIIAARDLYYSYVLYMEELAEARGAGYFARLRDCFAVPRIRRATVGASVVMLAQQMCGINIISFYSSTVFVESGFSDQQALYASLGFGALNFTFAIPALFTIDTFGRRSLLLSTFPFMIITLLGTGLSFLIPYHEGGSKARLGVVATFIYLFTCFYSVGEGPVCFLYGAEVFPTVQREQGMAFAVFVNMLFAGVLGLTFPAMKTAMTPLGAFCFYAGLCAIAFVLIFLFVPETKGISLEELDDVFSVPSGRFISYQTKQWLPYFVKRRLLCNSRAQPPPPLRANYRDRAKSGVLEEPVDIAEVDVKA